MPRRLLCHTRLYNAGDVSGKALATERSTGHTKLLKFAPVLAALLLLTGVVGAVRELISFSEAGNIGTLGWFNLLVNVAIVVISAVSLVLFRRANR